MALDKLTGENSVLFIRSEQLFDLARAQLAVVPELRHRVLRDRGTHERRRPALRLRPLRHLPPRLARGRPTS